MADPPIARTKDFFASPALSLSLAGVFRNGTAEPAAEDSVEENSGGLGGDEADMSSENADLGLRSDEDDADGNRKKRKKYHRHTTEQIREMEALFKDSPHPDEKQRQQLSKKLGLSARQVKFWFQNRRTQIKAIQERHENSVLKTEMEKLRDENQSLRENMKAGACLNCGYSSGPKDAASFTSEEQQLRIENAKLKAEVEKLRGAVGNFSGRTTSPTSSSSGGGELDQRVSIDYCASFFGLEKVKIVEIVHNAMEELMKMATVGEPLWVRSLETGRDILNYDEYVRQFSPDQATNSGGLRWSVEASRESGLVFMDAPKLVHVFMDVNQWKDMFPCMVAKSATVEVIASGEDTSSKNGLIQLMFSELQMLTPMVPTREVYFVRYCKQQADDTWAIVDVSIDKANGDEHVKCRKRSSGCLIQDKANGHCKITWVEHMEVKKMAVHSMYRSIVNGGLAFGAKHWMATLQLQCERLVFFMATNVPTKDSNGVATQAGRRSTLRLAQRMSSSFCRAVGAGTYHTWTKVTGKTGEDVRVSSRKNISDPAEPVGIIVCAVSSLWLPVSPLALFDFLKDDARRNEWDIMSNGASVQTIANIAKGQDRGNLVTLHATSSNDTAMWILQDASTNAYESMVVYAPVDIAGMQSVMSGCDSSNLALLPSGFSILPDGIETRPLVITSKPNEKGNEGGSLLTVAFQILANPSPTAKITTESNMETVNTLISCTLQKIKTSLNCEDA